MARPSGQLSMAVLVLLAAAAGTRVVAADLGAVAGDRGVGGGVGLGEAGLFGFLVEIGRAHAELQSLMRISYAVFCLKKKNGKQTDENAQHKHSHYHEKKP